MSDFTRQELLKILIDNQIYNHGNGINLDGVNLSNLDLKGVNFKNFSLRNCFADNSDFSYSNLSGADFTGASLNNSLFYYSNFENAIVSHSKSKFNNSNFKNAKIGISPNSEFSASYFSGEHIYCVSHLKIILEFLVLENINCGLQLFKESELRNSKLKNSKFNEPNLFGKKVKIIGNEISNCNFYLCDNKEVTFQENELLNCNFKSNDFEKCNFIEILFFENICESCRFLNCNFKNVSFYSNEGTNVDIMSFLNRVTFENCEFDEVTFSGTYFQNSQFNGCKFNNVQFNRCFIGSDDIKNAISPFFNNHILEGIEEENIVLTFEYTNTEGEQAKIYEKFFKFNFKI